MKKIFAMICIVSSAFSNGIKQKPSSISFDVSPTSYAKLNLFIGLVGNPSSQLKEIASIIKQDLQYTDQCEVNIQMLASVQSKKMVETIFKQGYPLAIFLNESDDNQHIEYRVYDTTQVMMLKGSSYTKRGTILRGWAHNLSDALWHIVSGQEGFFSTKIAFAKDIYNPKKKKIKHIYIADYDGSNQQELVTMPTVCIAPRWNNDINSPALFYSEYTNSNVRLVSISMKKKRKIASNFDGINMLPAFSADGKNVAYCASHGHGNCQLYYYVDGGFKKITHNNGNNVSPSFSADGKTIYFCSDFQTGNPQLYSYSIADDALERLTHGGYCASPLYCPSKQILAYSKMVNGIMQLFTYDIVKKTHEQITFDVGNKEECSWSPCGNFMLFSHELAYKSRIAMLNTITKKYHYVTDEKETCSYPSWSPIYRQFPVAS